MFFVDEDGDVLSVYRSVLYSVKVISKYCQYYERCSPLWFEMIAELIVCLMFVISQLKGLLPGFCSFFCHNRTDNTTCYSFSCTKCRFHRKRKISSEFSNRHQLLVLSDFSKT